MSTDIASVTISKLLAACAEYRDKLDKMERENASLRAAAVEVCALARVWVTVWGDKLSAESIKRLEQLEKQILKDNQ